MLTLAEQAVHHAEAFDPQGLADAVSMAKWIPVLPLVAMLVCGLLGCLPNKGLRKFAAPVTIAGIAGAFAISAKVALAVMGAVHAKGFEGVTVHAFDWIHVGDFAANFAFYIDGLTSVMLLTVTGVGTLIAIYASGYMSGDHGYFRFFAYISLFIVAMTLLVLADNLVLLYLGWEGVGLASYLLIGFYYRKPSAVAAAKKAFIVNRVGDFGFALGIMMTFLVFGVVGYDALLGSGGVATAEHVAGLSDWKQNAVLIIPFLLMLGAFGKSAQLPLHVWLPDAMEGPTPVSALIHAATMVTAGVYMVCRLMPIFQLNPAALYTVAIVGGCTALFAATIALCQYDIKRIWAYSTCSQLGYMFLGAGVMGTTGAVFHLFTHAFFKALLFLTAGSVMHALAGQLDLRKMSGLYKKMPVTAVLMLIGCLALAGVPFTSGFFSKDMIITEALIKHPALGWIAIGTALLTAFYTFRLWFRVFMGPTEYEMGREHHGYEMDHEPDDHHHGPHEMPWLMNAPLVILAVGGLILGWVCYKQTDFIKDMLHGSSAYVSHKTMAQELGMTLEEYEHLEHEKHAFVSLVSGGGALVMIALAAFFFWFNRGLAASIAKMFGPVATFLNRKWYIDELYHAVIVTPLRAIGWACYLLFDRFILDGVIYDGIFQYGPKLLAEAQAPTQRGKLQGFAMTMGLGLLIVLAVIAWSVVK